MTDEVKCSRPGSVRQGRILCNSVHMMEGTKCLLECDHGMVPRHEEVTVCQEVGKQTFAKFHSVQRRSLLSTSSFSLLKAPMLLSQVIGILNKEQHKDKDYQIFNYQRFHSYLL